MGKALDIIDKLQIKEFDWKYNNEHDIGLIAEEVNTIFPEAVVKKNGEVLKNDTPKSVLIAPSGLFLCDEATCYLKIGEYGEPLGVVPENVMKIGMTLYLFSYLGPKKAYDLIKKEYNLNLPEAEHDCIACNEFFDNTNKKLFRDIASDEKRLNKLLKENL